MNAKESQRTSEHFAIKVCVGEYVRNLIGCVCNYKVFHTSAKMKMCLNHSFFLFQSFLDHSPLQASLASDVSEQAVSCFLQEFWVTLLPDAASQTLCLMSVFGSRILAD